MPSRSVVTGSLGAIAISAFWSLLNECVDPYAAKRLFPRVAGASTLGAVLEGYFGAVGGGLVRAELEFEQAAEGGLERGRVHLDFGRDLVEALPLVDRQQQADHVGVQRDVLDVSAHDLAEEQAGGRFGKKVHSLTGRSAPPRAP